jgi:hypothetical protein
MQEEIKPKLSGMPGQAIIESADYFVSGLLDRGGKYDLLC